MARRVSLQENLAGFPCQAFSIAGRRAGFDDDYHGTCRGTLFHDVVRICDYHKPKIIFCENVKGLVNHDKGRTFKIICNAFAQIGYKIFYKVLNSKDFGLAQNRERIYIVCFRKDIAAENFNFPAPSDENFFIEDILEHAPVPSKYYLSDVYLETLRKHRARHEAAGNSFGYEIKNLDGVAGALVCGGMGRERNLIVDAREHSKIPTTKIKGAINDENIRNLTPREWARLQGFPDDFNLILSDTRLYKQFGNTVSIDVVESIAQEIRSVLEPMAYNKGEWSELYVMLRLLADGARQKNVPAMNTFEVYISATCGIISLGDKVSSKEGNKKYRDTVFRDYFNEPVRLLSLCNAILGTQYSDVAELKINTLEGIFFDNQKNDISCTIGDNFLVLVEHQTSVNDNMPFRCLSYVTELLKLSSAMFAKST